MDRAEAIKRIEDHIRIHRIGEFPHIYLKEALDMAIAALRADNSKQGWDLISVQDNFKIFYDKGRSMYRVQYCPNQTEIVDECIFDEY